MVLPLCREYSQCILRQSWTLVMAANWYWYENSILIKCKYSKGCVFKEWHSEESDKKKKCSCETVDEHYHLEVCSMIRAFIKEDHCTNQDVQCLAVDNDLIKKKEQIQKEYRLSTVLRRQRTVSLNKCVWEIAHNLYFGSCKRLHNVEVKINDGKV